PASPLSPYTTLLRSDPARGRPRRRSAGDAGVQRHGLLWKRRRILDVLRIRGLAGDDRGGARARPRSETGAAGARRRTRTEPSPPARGWASRRRGGDRRARAPGRVHDRRRAVSPLREPDREPRTVLPSDGGLGWGTMTGGEMEATNAWCEALGIARPRLESVVDHREANTFSLLLVALLERGQPMTLVQVASRFEEV